MEIDLFQGILLGLLALGLIVLLALLSTLGGIRKALERASSEGGASTIPAATASAPRVESSTQAEPEPVAAAAAVTPAVQETPQATAATPASGAVQEDSQAATIRAVLSQHGVTEPRAATTPAAQTTEPASVVAAHIDNEEPEEEPFQRDGRWWFKRGGELLVYNEGTAQWEPAERPAHWTSGAASATPTSSMVAPAASTAATAATAPQPVVASAGTGWKCPSCGAINGSTAASCRMCFTARP